MILCKIESWPDGVDAQKLLGEVHIRGIGGDHEIGHYRAELLKTEEIVKHPGPWRSGQVLNFKRRMLGPYDLLLRGLVACIGARSLADARRVAEDASYFGPPSSFNEVA